MFKVKKTLPNVANEQNKFWLIENSLKINFKTPQNAEIFIKSFSPELETMPLRRSKLQLTQDRQFVVFEIFAEDINAFRANMNSILQFSNVVMESIKLTEKE